MCQSPFKPPRMSINFNKFQKISRNLYGLHEISRLVIDYYLRISKEFKKLDGIAWNFKILHDFAWMFPKFPEITLDFE